MEPATLLPQPLPGPLRLALLVDRDDDTRRMYAEYLRLANCASDEAWDGRDALVLAMSRHPDVIVTDTRLPGIGGLELCRILRLEPLTLAIPIVIVTSDSFPPHVDVARNSGADAVLIKPCLPDRLLQYIREVIAKSHELRRRGETVRSKLGEQIARSAQLLEVSAGHRRKFLARTHQRFETTTPAERPPGLICPQCDTPLTYQRSHIGGVSERHSEQWDYYECPEGCGTFQYRQRTRKIRKV